MTRPLLVALVRHPRPLVAPGVCYGRLDLPLHPGADAQIIEIQRVLVGFEPDAVWSSPAQRCSTVATRLSGATQVKTDSRLLELDFGAWEGVAWDAVPRDSLDEWASDVWSFAAPGGESGAALAARVTEFHHDLRIAGGTCVVVSHGGPLKVLRALLRGDAIDLLAPAPMIGAVEIITAA